MATFTKFEQFVEDLAKGVHDFTSTGTAAVTVALTTQANIPLVTNSILGDLTEVAYTFLSTRIVAGIGCEQTTGTVSFTATDHVLTASGGAVATFRHVVLYNDTPSSPLNPLIGWYDYGSDVTLADGETFTIDFTAVDWATLA